jgi:hypothetical protein
MIRLIVGRAQSARNQCPPTDIWLHTEPAAGRVNSEPAGNIHRVSVDSRPSGAGSVHLEEFPDDPEQIADFGIRSFQLNFAELQSLGRARSSC